MLSVCSCVFFIVDVNCRSGDVSFPINSNGFAAKLDFLPVNDDEVVVDREEDDDDDDDDEDDYDDDYDRPEENEEDTMTGGRHGHHKDRERGGGKSEWVFRIEIYFLFLWQHLSLRQAQSCLENKKRQKMRERKKSSYNPTNSGSSLTFRFFSLWNPTTSVRRLPLWGVSRASPAFSSMEWSSFVGLGHFLYLRALIKLKRKKI